MALLCLSWVGYCAKSYLDKYETQPRKDNLRIAEEQTKRAELELERARLRRRKRKPKPEVVEEDET
jgi:hypothetical protein